MHKVFLTLILFLGLTSIANAQNTDTTKNEPQNISVLAFSHDSKDEVSTANVLDGKNEFLVVKAQTIANGRLAPRGPYISINKENYAILQSTEELAALEDKNSKDGELNSADKNFDQLYAASFVSKGSDKEIKLTKLSNEANALMIKKESFDVKSNISTHHSPALIWAGKAVSINSLLKCKFLASKTCVSF